MIFYLIEAVGISIILKEKVPLPLLRIYILHIQCIVFANLKRITIYLYLGNSFYALLYGRIFTLPYLPQQYNVITRFVTVRTYAVITRFVTVRGLCYLYVPILSTLVLIYKLLLISSTVFSINNINTNSVRVG